jgi:uncharacterized protein YidB (DUF937 family)
MQVAALRQFLQSLKPALEVAGSHQAAGEVAEAARALSPFDSLAVADFAAFLVRAKDYQAAGTVRVPSGSERQAEDLVQVVAKLTEVAKSPAASDLATLQHETAAALQTVAVSAGLKGKLTIDPKWAGAQAARARVAPYVRTIYDLAARIISPDVYNDPNIRDKMARLESALDAETLKAVAAEFGIKTTAKSQTAKVVGDILAKLTGHKPAKTSAKAKAASVDSALVDEHAQRLAKLVERSADPAAISDSELDAELGRLKGIGKNTLNEVANRAGIEGVRAGDSIANCLDRIRLRLTAARRAKERAES